MRKILDVKTNSYTTSFHQLDDYVIKSEREHLWSKNSEQIDIFSHCWSLVLGNYHNGDLGVKRKNDLFLFQGLWGFLLPPFSIIHWYMKGGPLYWESYTVVSPPPLELPLQAIAFKVDEMPRICNYTDLLTLVKNAPKETIPIYKAECENAVALRTKRFLDLHYEKDMSIKEISQQLNYSHSVMTRYFKKNYSMSVIKYRNQLRLFDSLLQLLSERSKVYQAAYISGHKDLSKFYRYFKNFFGTSPSSYSAKDHQQHIIKRNEACLK